MYYTYILRCVGGTLYTGITTDVKRRFEEHTTDSKKGAKYTGSRKPIRVEAVWKSESRALASKLEYRIKQLTKAEKEELIKGSGLEMLGDKIDATEYERENENEN